MSALMLQNNALWSIFEDFTFSILLGVCFLIYVVRNQFSNDLPARDNKITNEITTRVSEIFTAELGKINTELNDKLTAEIAKFKAHNDGYTKEAQKILSMINNVTSRLNTIEEACRNDFGRISSEFTTTKASIEALQNKICQQSDELDDADRQSHASSSSGSSNSGLLSFKGISLTVWTQFKEIFNRIRAEKGFNLEEMCLHVAMEIRALGGTIKRATVQGFYERNVKKRDGHIHTLDDIGLWVDSKLNVNNNNSNNNNNNE